VYDNLRRVAGLHTFPRQGMRKTGGQKVWIEKRPKQGRGDAYKAKEKK